MNVAAITRPDASLLVGRDAVSYADDIVALEGDGCGYVLRSEIDAVMAVLELRAADRHAPTRARTMAVELAAPISLVCPTIEAADMVVSLARDWIVGLGDVRAFARNLDAGREHARNLFNATLADPSADARADYDAFRADLADLEERSESEWQVSGCARAVFRIHDAHTIAAILDVWQRQPQIVALVDIDDEEGGPRATTPTPELVA